MAVSELEGGLGLAPVSGRKPREPLLSWLASGSDGRSSTVALAGLGASSAQAVAARHQGQHGGAARYGNVLGDAQAPAVPGTRRARAGHVLMARAWGRVGRGFVCPARRWSRRLAKHSQASVELVRGLRLTERAGRLEPRAAQPAGAAGLDLSLGHI